MNRSVVQQTSVWSGRAAWLTLLVVLVGLTGVAGRAQQGQGPGQSKRLFQAGGEQADGAPDQADRTKKRGRRVRVDTAALQQADASGGAEIITLNLFDDVQLRARRSRLDPTRSGGTVWHGRLLDVAGEATFAIQDGVVSGTVFAGDKVFEVLYAGDGEHEVREIEPAEFATDDPQADLAPVEPDPQAEAMDAAVAAGMAGDTASQIDVMVIWTPAARTSAGGTSAIQSLVNLAVANANTAYANSAVTQRLRLVYSGEVSYTEGAASTDLGRLSALTDGYLDQVHALRNTYGADVVTLLGNGYACGLGYLMTYASTGFASTAFNVVDRTCAAGNLSYAHELGHNMGLQHDPNNASGSGAYSYAYGYQQPAGAFRTVMAYPCPTGSCPRLMYFANPSVSYSGMPTGTASQNTALALNNTASSVANFRQAVTGSCSYSLSTTSASAGSGTATSSVGVTAGSGCAWAATSNASWLTITSGASGSGSGSTGFSISANPAGTPRSSTLTVAGLTYTVNQAAAACGAFTISPTSQANVAASGASLSVTVTGTTGCARTATSNASWITVTAGATGTGLGTVSLSVAANTVAAARTGTVTVAGQTYTVTQLAAACGAFTISPTSQANVAAAGASLSVGVTGTAACGFSTTSNASWITVSSGGAGTGSGTVVLSVAANPGGTVRTGTVMLAGQTYTVTQLAAACGAFTISPTSQANVAAAGASLSVGVTGTAACGFSTTSNASWITVSSGGAGTGSGTVVLSVAANPGGTVRTGTVMLAGQTYTVTQLAAACGAFTISPTSQANVAAAGASLSVGVTGTAACGFSTTSNASWITVSSGGAGTGSGTVVLSVAANPGGTVRTGTVMLAGQTYTVTQLAAACGAFTISPTSQANVAAAGASLSVGVTGTAACGFSTTSNASWITVSSGGAGTGSGTVVLSVAANPGGTVRTGTVMLAGQTYTVTQLAAACGAFTISPTSQANVAAAGASLSVGVTGTAACGFSTTSNASWITVSSGGAGTGSGTVVLSVAANPGGTVRTGTVMLAGQTYTVTQLAAACGAFSLSPTSANLGAAGGPVTTLVNGTLGCARTATSNAAWISVTGGASASGSGTASLSVAANLLGTPRSGTVTIGGQIFTVSQSAAACTYAITPGSASLPGDGGPGSFSLTTPTGCAAAATSSASWVTVTGGATGSASRTVSYTVAANAGGARSASISVGGQNFSVSQAKKANGSRANSAKADFNGDSMADLLWQHDNGAVGLWRMNGLSAGEIVMLTPGQVDPVWRMVGSGDLNGDGKPEIVWQHQTGGWLLAWFMNGEAVQQAVYLTPNQVSTAWRIVAITDINGDARADLIWQHDQGALQVWYMNGTTRIGGGSLNPAAVDGNDWKIVGADDVNGDLKPDLIWQQSSTGLIGAWLMNGVTATSFVLMTPSRVDRAWHIRGVVDLDSDGKTDLIWQHDNGALGVWLMAGTTATSMQPISPASVGAGWRLVGPR